MFCHKCGKINPDSEEKCSGCGAQLHQEIVPVVADKKNNALKICLICIAVVIVVLIVVFLFGGCKMEVPTEKMSF